MLEFIKGKITKLDKNKIIVEKDGFGILIYVPDCEKFSDEDKVYTVLKVKEEEIRVIGFKTQQEKELFNKLTQIHGVGEKHALAILGTFSVDEFIDIIDQSDIESLTKVQGIGKKTAQRIIVELKGKIYFPENSLIQDLVKTLINLGFDKDQSYKVVKEILKVEDNLEEVLKKAISTLASHT
ncbi:Holliday junction branch migration protein RuvA [Sulfurihydrogenibium subterraneum]|uniref:Holliday junction branch migration protein RuvA n=1 Tax=Sulfurihydrogenibium subterraneum TaxID=171121 RepID=UPI000491D586|nr:Holliday junction branch migration protein RuvA [Sulfurihydrogenibium subterraneum]